MNKKFVAIICAVIMLLGVLSSCSFIYKNEERDLDQVVISASYGGRTSTVSKSELTTTYNSTGYQYIYSYGLTAEEAFDYMLKSLTNSLLLELRAKDYLDASIVAEISTENISNPTTKQLIAEMEAMLPDKYIMNAVVSTNETFQTAYDEYIAEIEEEKAVIDQDTEEEEEEEVTIDYKEDRFKERFSDEEEEVVIPAKFFDSLTTTPTADQSEALRRLNKAISAQYVDYDYYYEGNLLSELLDYYEQTYVDDYIADNPVTEVQIQVRYEEMIAAEKLSYDNDENAYATALGSDPSSLLYHPDYDVATEKGYFYVKNILLPFSDEQKALLSSVEATGNYTDEAIEIYRSSLASEILVNVYNVDIGADDEADYFDTELDITLGSVVGGYGVVDDPLTIDIDESIVPDEVNYVYQREDVPLNTIFQEIVTDLNAATTLEDLIKVYEDWTFLVNEDAGAFKGIISDSTDYLVSPEGKSSTYVTEFTDLSRGLFELGVGAYGGVTGAIVDGITIINYNADLTYCVTDYGVHIVLVSEIPFDYAVDKNTNQVTVNDEGMPLKTLDYNVNDEETIRDIIRETLENEYAKTYYSYDRREFFKSSSDSVETYEKIYKELMKEAVKLEELVAGS